MGSHRRALRVSGGVLARRARWDTNGRIRTESDHRIRRRLTDEYVAERQLAWKIERKESRWNPWPLSSVVDLITPSVIRCARILTELNGLDAVDRIGFRSRVVEAYPIAALRLWGVPTYNYKRTAADCGRILDDLSSRTGLARPTLDAPVARGRDDDAVDAFVCALVARAVANASGGTGPEGAGEAYGSEVETIRREGWIHLPFKGEPIEALAIGSPPVQQ